MHAVRCKHPSHGCIIQLFTLGTPNLMLNKSTVAQAIPQGSPLSDLTFEVTWLIGRPCANIVVLCLKKSSFNAMFTVICGVTLVAAVKNLELNSYLGSMELYWWFVWPNFDVLCGSVWKFWLCVCSRGLVHLQWRKTQSWIQESKVWVVRRQSTLLNRPSRLHQRLIHQWIILEAQVADFTLQTRTRKRYRS